MKVYIKLNSCFVIIRYCSHKSPAHKYITINDKNKLLLVLTSLNPGRTNGSLSFNTEAERLCGEMSEIVCKETHSEVTFLPLYL